MEINQIIGETQIYGDREKSTYQSRKNEVFNEVSINTESWQTQRYVDKNKRIISEDKTPYQYLDSLLTQVLSLTNDGKLFLGIDSYKKIQRILIEEALDLISQIKKQKGLNKYKSKEE